MRVIVLDENIKGITQPNLFANLAVLLELVEKVICSDFLRPSLASAIQAILCEVFVFRLVKFQYIIKSAAWCWAVIVARNDRSQPSRFFFNG